jgi:pseudouridine-5'-phosphate glycosidase
MRDLITVTDEVQTALEEGRAVVALETTLIAHGFPAPDGLETGLESEAAVRSAGAIPATVGVLDGEIRIGLARDELERFTPGARKLGPRDLAVCAVQGAVGATTVGGTLTAAAAVGIRFMGTGGLGGVHRGFPVPPDVSADLAAAARIPAVIASSGVKSLLDVSATVELLETLGVPVIGYRTDTLPLFYNAAGGPPVSSRADDVIEIARIADAHWRLGGNAILVGRPPSESLDVTPLIEEAVAAAERERISGQGVTPFVLAYLHEHSHGETRRVNRDLIVENAGLAGAIATAYATSEIGDP